VTEAQAKKLLELLERIAVALERQPAVSIVNPVSQCFHERGPEALLGAGCKKCGAWLGAGT